MFTESLELFGLFESILASVIKSSRKKLDGSIISIPYPETQLMPGIIPNLLLLLLLSPKCISDIHGLFLNILGIFTR